MWRFFKWQVWTSLIIMILCQLGVLAAESNVSIQYVAGKGDDSYCDLSLKTGWDMPNGWQLSVAPLVRAYAFDEVAKFRLANEIKINHDTGWDKLNLNYTRFDQPEDVANMYNLGYEHKSKLKAWWNPGEQGSWVARIKGEHKAYSNKPHRDYVSGEWELYSESKEPINRPSWTDQVWSTGIFDFSVNRALEGQDWFLDGWVLGEALINSGEDYQHPWAESADKISTKLISRIGGGWSNHYRNSQYTWRVNNYELQWQQQISPASSLKFGYRTIDKTYPDRLTKSYHTREHLLRWLGKGEQATVETGLTYDSKRYLAGKTLEEYQVWLSRTGRGNWPKSLKIQGRIQTQSELKPDASVTASFGLELPKSKKWAGKLTLKADHKWDKLISKKTTVTSTVSTTRKLRERCDLSVALDRKWVWEDQAVSDDWGAKIGLKLSL